MAEMIRMENLRVSRCETSSESKTSVTFDQGKRGTKNIDRVIIVLLVFLVLFVLVFFGLFSIIVLFFTGVLK